MPPSYDPGLNLLYFGTSVTSPAPKFMLAGNDYTYLYHNSTLALDGDTGEIVWYYQHNVDHWDLDHPFERLLVDTAVSPDPAAVSWINPNLRPGEERRVVTGIPGKTGIVYTLDRETGEFLWATPTILQNVVTQIDGATGAVSVDPQMLYTGAEQTLFVCPGLAGGKNWPAGAYNPETNTMYMPLQRVCMNARSIAEEPALGELYAIDVEFEITPGADGAGTVYAISAESGETVWIYEQRASTTSLITTGGGLIFGGDANGRFRALDQESGEVLWEVNIGSQVTGFPVTFAVDGRQYVAVSTGRSLITGSLLELTPELRPGSGNNLFVFALPD
jgi:alcohol dehydrogenase (cytochrome c)